MAKKQENVPRYGTAMRRGIQYYRTRITDADGKRVDLYAETCEELQLKEMEARRQVEEAVFRRKHPTVAEYCEKWLLMQSAKVYSGLRREEILGLQWDCVFLDVPTPYISVRRAWRSEHNRPVISTTLKTKAARRDIPIPKCLTDCLREVKEKTESEYVVADRNGNPLSSSQFQRVWKYVTVRSTKPHNYYKYVNGQCVKCTVTPTPGSHQKNNPKLVYAIDFDVTPHQLRHTYITNLLYAGIDPKTVQYLAGHENSKTTMDIYAQVKYNKPEELLSVVNAAFAPSVGV